MVLIVDQQVISATRRVTRWFRAWCWLAWTKRSFLRRYKLTLSGVYTIDR